MPRTCTVCRHLERIAIDTALVAGTASFRTLADRFGPSASAFRRHKETHLLATLAKAREAQEVAQGDSILAQVRTQYRETQLVLAQAKEAGDLRTALRAVDAAGRMLGLQARLFAKLDEEMQSSKQTAGGIGYICWIGDDGKVIGETFEPPFIADGDERSYIGVLRRASVFAKAQQEGRVVELTCPKPTSGKHQEAVSRAAVLGASSRSAS